MTHRSRPEGFIIDCEGGDLAAAGEIWAAALGNRRRRKPQGKYDIPAEVARLERLGAQDGRAGAHMGRDGGAGHRFCIIRAKTRDFAAKANTWEDGA